MLISYWAQKFLPEFVVNLRAGKNLTTIKLCKTVRASLIEIYSTLMSEVLELKRRIVSLCVDGNYVVAKYLRRTVEEIVSDLDRTAK